MENEKYTKNLILIGIFVSS